MLDETNAKSMTIIVTKGTLDWAYPPFILATTAAAMGLEVSMFFTFYGLTLLKKKLDLGISTLGNPAMKMPMMGMHMAMPNLVSAMPGADAMATAMMKNLIKRKGVASIKELRDAALEAEVKAHDFFARALALPVAEPVRKLFEQLEQEEVLHQDLVNKQLSNLPPDSGASPEDYADEPVAQ